MHTFFTVIFTLCPNQKRSAVIIDLKVCVYGAAQGSCMLLEDMMEHPVSV